MEITPEEKKILLKAARDSIALYFENREPAIKDYASSPLLESQCGAFVTLTIKKRLRGCIGFITGSRPLINTIFEAARYAAFDDHRFPSLSKDELAALEIEISILSVPFAMNDYDDIVVGTHGLILEEKGRKGLLLPQVPIEHKMNKEEYLDAICEKTGFPEGYWRDKKLKMKLFTADIFSEREIGV